MDHLLHFLLIAAGVLAGFVDSIAGGGGLITVPVFTLILGPGAEAIGTNKVVAVVATAVALFIYRRGGHVTLRGNWIFAGVVGGGAICGAWSSRFVPPEAYKWLIILVAPFILWIVFRKELWIKRAIKDEHPAPNPRLLLLAGVLCGFYDGIAGPGGGTLMFLSLFVLARLPLLTSMATAKIANVASSSLSLLTYALTGHVVWNTGAVMAVGVAVGAAFGARMAIRNAAVIARFALLVVSSLLILRLILS